MIIMHKVDPRTGPNNAGSEDCSVCSAHIFADDGSREPGVALDNYTTDPDTYAACGTEDMADFQRCV